MSHLYLHTVSDLYPLLEHNSWSGGQEIFFSSHIFYILNLFSHFFQLDGQYKHIWRSFLLHAPLIDLPQRSCNTCCYACQAPLSHHYLGVVSIDFCLCVHVVPMWSISISTTRGLWVQRDSLCLDFDVSQRHMRRSITPNKMYVMLGKKKIWNISGITGSDCIVL